MLVRLQPQPLSLPYREKLVILYWYILTPLHLLLHICVYDRIFRLLSRPFFGQVLRGGSAGGRRVRRLRAVDSSVGLSSIRRVGAIFILRALWATWILSVLGRVCFRLWWYDVMMSHVASDCCYSTFGPLYAQEISIYISRHVFVSCCWKSRGERLPCSLIGGTLCASISVIGVEALIWR